MRGSVPLCFPEDIVVLLRPPFAAAVEMAGAEMAAPDVEIADADAEENAEENGEDEF